MRMRPIPKTETRGFCHDCHNRAHVEISFSHRVPIRLCCRYERFLIMNVTEGIKPNGKNGAETKTPAGD